ncbi:MULTISPECIES: DNA gyrase inhibitor YacG [Novacetimonas]|uniref:DNA gyrase inhibitor YacG n=2 Tax=Novacetimonas TaxID=2919364 RepID=A0A318QAR6_9PROT|nr:MULTISPECIES: DNA gyrase inhibitor YacG [Novacetimonas]MBV1835210.1 DNA gyrase inhibitor YacG [Novacetimonas pomaceti]PYD47392.1 DNA gyrase inhibitor YacG [Novacetimonas pomaceti]PYD76015.1 DNA gyrase inhibitor YacG [Novacetimonas pomaceti]RBM08536.1 DNA gyrase inhibitor YacG [Novacetimonas cocois]
MTDTPKNAPAPCPVCGRPMVRDYRPFCSRRCADIDLGRWFTGQYRVPAGSDFNDMDENHTRRVDPDEEVG